MVLFFVGIFFGVIFGFLACAVLTASKTEEPTFCADDPEVQNDDKSNI